MVNLKSFIKILEAHNELKVVERSVSPNLEISKISRDALLDDNRAILFTQVAGSSSMLITNIFGNHKRIELALGNQPINILSNKIDQVNRHDNISNSLYPPNLYSYQKIDLQKLPAIKSYPDEGGRYFTLACVITKDPVTGIQNMGIYRMQVYDNKTAGMHWHTFSRSRSNFDKAQKLGQSSIEVAVILGCDPSIIMAAGLPFKNGVNEICLFEAVHGSKVAYTKCKTVDLVVPTNCEVVLEGIVPIGAFREEGPFGMFTGKYDTVTKQPVFHVTAMAYNDDGSIVAATVPGIPPAENAIMVSYGMKLFLQEVKADIKGVIDFHLPIEGVFNQILYVKILQGTSGESIFDDLWSHRLFNKFKTIILFDETVDLITVAGSFFHRENRLDILWRLGNISDKEVKSVKRDGKIGIDTRSEYC